MNQHEQFPASSMRAAGRPPGVALSLDGVARFLKSSQCKSVALLTGAGVSVAAGIPDFRSPGGMYATLKPELLTATEQQKRMMASDPTYVVEKTMFRANAFPYLEVRRPFILGTQAQQWKATIAHRFVELLHAHGKLTRVYTQNIDGLDFQCESVPQDKIVPVHGSIRQVNCEACGTEHGYDKFCSDVKTNIKDIYGIDKTAPTESTPIHCSSCGQPAVKPSTVLFGGALPSRFFELKERDLANVDLLIVAGTSLAVGPANTVAFDLPKTALRLVVNNEAVLAPDGAQRDIFAKGDCDQVFLDLVAKLGWTAELVPFRAALPPQSIAILDKELAEHPGGREVC